MPFAGMKSRAALRMLRVPLLAGALLAVAYAGASYAAPPPTRDVEVGTPGGGRVFAPSEATVAVNGTVNWTNVSDEEHTVTSDAAGLFNQALPENATFQRAFPQAGTFAYHCNRHPDVMRGRVVVGEFSRTVSISYSRGAFRGAIDSVRGPCERGQQVTVFKVRKGADQRLGAGSTDKQGAYSLAKARKPGRYYARVARTTPSGACLGAQSPELTLR